MVAGNQSLILSLAMCGLDQAPDKVKTILSYTDLLVVYLSDLNYSFSERCKI